MPWREFAAERESKLKQHTAWCGDMERKIVHVKNAVLHIMSVRRTHKRLKSHDPSKNYLSKLSQTAHAASYDRGGSLSLAFLISAKDELVLKSKEIVVEMLPKYHTTLRIPSVADHLIAKHIQENKTCIELTPFMSVGP